MLPLTQKEGLKAYIVYSHPYLSLQTSSKAKDWCSKPHVLKTIHQEFSSYQQNTFDSIFRVLCFGSLQNTQLPYEYIFLKIKGAGGNRWQGKYLHKRMQK